MMRHTWIGVLMLGLLPAVASAEHRDSARFSFGFGVGIHAGYSDYRRPYAYSYAPSVYYRSTWCDPAPVYCPQSAVVYEQPVAGYPYAGPTVVYTAPQVTYSPTVVVPAPRYLPPAGYYSQTRYYHGR